MAISGHRPPRLECKNPRRNAAVYHAKRLGFFRDWTVKNDVLLCSRYVALPAIIPHGGGEGERFIHGGDGDVGHSVSRLTSPCVFSTASTSYVPFPVDLSSATFVVLTTSVNGNARGLASTVMTASSFVSECLSGDKSMQVVYASEQDNYTAYAYYSSGKVYLKSRSQYDSAVFIVL
jgi:hypothetical protein